jgi:hypothetical protein
MLLAEDLQRSLVLVLVGALNDREPFRVVGARFIELLTEKCNFLARHGRR